MKKTFSININGIIFNIDDDAYDKLSAYLNSIKKHFINVEGSDEIFSDIESRIAEILQNKINENKQVITIDDINVVIAIMGQPYEFGEEEDEQGRREGAYYETRDAKRLYRDTENRVIGGVCSGLGAYFRLDPLWFRLGFLIALITGFGILVYLVLWIAVPEARTTVERLEMKGEKVNVSNIEKSIREEFNHLKNKFNDITNQAKQSYKKNKVPKTIFEDILNIFVSIFKIFLKILVIFIGIILFIIGISLIIAFLASFFGWGGFVFFNHCDIITFPLPVFADMLFNSVNNIGLFKVGLFFLIGIPLILLLYSAVRLIFGLERIKFVGITAFNFWIVGLIFTVYFGFKIFRSFKYEVAVKEVYEITQPTKDTVYINLNDFYDEIYDYEDYIEIDEWDMVITESGKYFGEPKIEFTKSENDNYQLIGYSFARGKTGKDAKERAEKSIYHFTQTDTLFVFDRYFKLPEDVNWREQRLRLEFKIPVGKSINMSNNIYDIINWRKHHYPYKMSGKTLIMTRDGLKKME
ncbi:MAG: PspC domain-containing protein [Bacteroidales bacterium]|nr:PspC domain-containing protein [Bacteroidales bacterium]